MSSTGRPPRHGFGQKLQEVCGLLWAATKASMGVATFCWALWLGRSGIVFKKTVPNSCKQFS
jgi:hypothetical protein